MVVESVGRSRGAFRPVGRFWENTVCGTSRRGNAVLMFDKDVFRVVAEHVPD